MRAFGKFWVLLLAVLMWGCTSRSLPDEDVIRHIVRLGAEAAENNDVKSLMGYVADDYSDDAGNDRRSLRALLLRRLLTGERLTVFLRDVDIEVEGERALVDARVLFVRGGGRVSLSEVIPDEASALRFSVVFVRRDDRWLVRSAAWEPIGAAELL